MIPLPLGVRELSDQVERIRSFSRFLSVSRGVAVSLLALDRHPPGALVAPLPSCEVDPPGGEAHVPSHQGCYSPCCALALLNLAHPRSQLPSSYGHTRWLSEPLSVMGRWRNALSSPQPCWRTWSS